MNASSPLRLASMKYESDGSLPLESKLKVPVDASYSYASLFPFVSSGTSASGELKNTRRPSSESAWFRWNVTVAAPVAVCATLEASTVALAPVGLHDTHTT